MTEFENKLIIENLGLVDQVIKSRISWRRGSVLMSYEDLQAVGREALCRAATRYKPNIGEFQPFAARCVYNAVIDHCKKENTYTAATADYVYSDSQDSPAEKSAPNLLDMESKMDSQAVCQILDRLKEQYSGIAKLGVEAIELKLLGVRTSEIAAKYGTSVRNVNAWISRARSKLKAEPILLNYLV